MKLVDPVVTRRPATGRLAPRVDTLRGKRVGLWSNGNINADALLHAVEAELRRRHDVAPGVIGTFNGFRSLEPGEEWLWCYVDEFAFVVSGG